MLINSYKEKRVVDYLKDGMNVCIKFHHGLGDLFMFLPAYEKLKRLYPSVKFDLWVANGQEEYVGKSKINESEYDYVFALHFPMNEYENPLRHTKASLCAETELGMSFDAEDEFTVPVKHYPSPLVGVHFYSTCLPGIIGCPEAFGKQVWNDIKESGLIPIETHFIHNNDDSRKNAKYNFIDRDVRNEKCNIANLIGLLGSCCGFVGVSSGPFHVAANMYPERCLHLKNRFDVKTHYAKKDILYVEVNKPLDKRVFQEWVGRIKK